MHQLAAHRYIVTDGAILSGEPIIAGTLTPVWAIVELYRLDIYPENIPHHLPHLSPAQVFDALSYYSDHQGDINQYIARNHVPDDLIDSLVRSVWANFIVLYLDEDVDVLLTARCVLLLMNRVTADKMQDQLRYIWAYRPAHFPSLLPS